MLKMDGENLLFWANYRPSIGLRENCFHLFWKSLLHTVWLCFIGRKFTEIYELEIIRILVYKVVFCGINDTILFSHCISEGLAAVSSKFINRLHIGQLMWPQSHCVVELSRALQRFKLAPLTPGLWRANVGSCKSDIVWMEFLPI